jgi:hypothetical protein
LFGAVDFGDFLQDIANKDFRWQSLSPEFRDEKSLREVRRLFCVSFYFREVAGVTMPTFGAIFSPVFMRGLEVFHEFGGLTGF